MDAIREIHLEIHSTDEQVDRVQVVAEDFGRAAGLEGDEVDWMGMAVREAVVNAIVHGNKNDPRKHVFVDFAIRMEPQAAEVLICVRDQGDGFDPAQVPDPLAPENIMKASGRGIFMISQFMDDVLVRPSDEGGTEVRMCKRIPR
jgi:serine/threonine-protein kinase RsbW